MESNVYLLIHSDPIPDFQEIRLVGSIEQLGNWNVADAKKAEFYSEGKYIMRSTLRLIIGQPCEMKMIVVNKETEEVVRWESLPSNINRILIPEFALVGLSICIDNPLMTFLNLSEPENSWFMGFFEMFKQSQLFGRTVEEFVSHFNTKRQSFRFKKDLSIFDGLSLEEICYKDNQTFVIFCDFLPLCNFEKVSHGFKAEFDFFGNPLLSYLIAEIKNSNTSSVRKLIFIGKLRDDPFVDNLEEKENFTNFLKINFNCYPVDSDESSLMKEYVDEVQDSNRRPTSSEKCKYFYGRKKEIFSYQSKYIDVLSSLFNGILLEEENEIWLYLIGVEFSFIIPHIIALEKKICLNTIMKFRLSDVSNFTKLPFAYELLTFLLKCNCLSFNEFGSANDFLVTTESILGIKVKAFTNLIYLEYQGFPCMIRFISPSIYDEYLLKMLDTHEYQEALEKYSEEKNPIVLIKCDSEVLEKELEFSISQYQELFHVKIFTYHKYKSDPFHIYALMSTCSVFLCHQEDDEKLFDLTFIEFTKLNSFGIILASNNVSLHKCLTNSMRFSCTDIKDINLCLKNALKIVDSDSFLKVPKEFFSRNSTLNYLLEIGNYGMKSYIYQRDRKMLRFQNELVSVSQYSKIASNEDIQELKPDLIILDMENIEGLDDIDDTGLCVVGFSSYSKKKYDYLKGLVIGGGISWIFSDTSIKACDTGLPESLYQKVEKTRAYLPESVLLKEEGRFTIRFTNQFYMGFDSIIEELNSYLEASGLNEEIEVSWTIKGSNSFIKMLAIQSFLEIVSNSKSPPKDILLISNSRRIIDFQGIQSLIYDLGIKVLTTSVLSTQNDILMFPEHSLKEIFKLIEQ